MQTFQKELNFVSAFVRDLRSRGNNLGFFAFNRPGGQTDRQTDRQNPQSLSYADFKIRFVFIYPTWKGFNGPNRTENGNIIYQICEFQITSIEKAALLLSIF